MSRDRLRVADYLEHILEATRRIEDYCHGMDQKAFLSNRLVQDAVIRNFEIIGEASRNIERVDPSFLTAHPELPLSFAYEMRNFLSHGYFKVDLALVWRTIKADLPSLRKQVVDAMGNISS